MPYQPAIKGKFLKKQTFIHPSGLDLSMAFGEVNQLIADLRGLRNEVVTILNNKTEEIDNKTQDLLDSVQLLKNTKSEIINYLGTVKKGDPGIPGNSVDEYALTNNIIEKVKTYIPQKIDEQALTNKILKSLPKNKASLKIIQESFTIDPMSVIEKILSLPEGKFKLTTKHIDGLEQTIAAFSHQLAKGYLHGGGDTVTAGTNVTITTNSAGQKVISSTGGGGGGSVSYTDEAPSTSDNITYTLSGTPVSGSLMLWNAQTGQMYTNVTDYTLSGTTVTFGTAQTGFTVRAKYATSSTVSFADEAATDSGDHLNFTISHTPTANSLLVYEAETGQIFTNGTDYTLSGSTITFTTAQTGVTIRSKYAY